MTRLIGSLLVVCLIAVPRCHAEGTEAESSQENRGKSFHFTLGPSGPVRKGTDFYAGEQVCLTVKVPLTEFSGHRVRFYCDYRLVSQTNQTMRVTRSEPGRIRGFVPGNGPAYFNILFRIPARFEQGLYDFSLTVMDSDGKGLLEENETLRVRSASAFGIRHPRYYHGFETSPPEWGPGSHVYSVSETVRITIGVGGLVADEDGKARFKLQSAISDGKGGFLSVSEQNIAFSQKKVSSHVPSDTVLSTNCDFDFELLQPGDYILKIVVSDTVSQTEDFLELPLQVLEPVE